MGTALSPLIETIRHRLLSVIVADERIAAAFIFGSVARGQTNVLSDVDIAVLLYDSDPPPLMYKPELLTEMMSALGRDDVDLVVLNEASAFLQHRILKEGICVFERDNHTRPDFQARAYSRYFDLLPFLKKVYGR